MKKRQKNTRRNALYSTIIALAIVFIVQISCSSAAVWNSTLSNNLFSYWTFNETSGMTALNSVNISLNLDVNYSSDWITGKINNGFSPDGNTTATTTINESKYNSMSINFWINKNGTITDTAGIIGNGNVESLGEWNLFFNANILRVRVYDDAGSQPLDDVLTLNTDVWEMVTLTINSSDVYLYGNGTCGVAHTALSNFVFKDEFSPRLFGVSAERIFNAKFDEFGIWNRTLTPNEITQLYNNGQGLTYGQFFVVNSQTYNPTTYEASSETFLINISYSSGEYSSISGNLIYNGTPYSGTKAGLGDNLIFSRTINIPTVPSQQIKNFYWSFALTNATGTFYSNSTTNQQTINNYYISRCNNSFALPILVNFTIYNESSPASMLNASMYATFFYKISGEIYKNYSLSTESNRTFTLCANTNKSFITNSVINLKSLGFITRTFYFYGSNYTNATTEESLYLLPDELGTNIIIQVKDSNNIPVNGWYVEISRYYSETGKYLFIEMQKTDLYGQFVARLIEDTERYRFVFKNPSGSIVKTTSDVTIACRAAICILSFIVEDTTSDFERFQNVSNYVSGWTWNNNTYLFTFTWTDTTGDSIINRLYVERFLMNGTTRVCNTTSALSTGSLNCNFGSQEANYQVQMFRGVGGVEKRIGVTSIHVGTTSKTFGKEGMIWSFFLLMTMITLGIWKPPVGIVLYLVGIIPLMMLKIIYINPAILIAQFVIGIIFIWAFKG